MFRAALVLSLLFVSAVAIAQEVKNDTFGVVATAPKAWEVMSSNDGVIAAFKHKKTKSQIRVTAAKLAKPESATSFFATYRKTLTESGFEMVRDPESRTIGDLEGKQAMYSFTQKSIQLDVVVFEFVRGDVAWIVTGYLQTPKLRPAVTEAISGLEFEDDADSESPSW